MSDYKNLLVWQKSIILVTNIYSLTDLFPTDEKFGLTSQMQRASVAIPSNIAEGHLRKHKKEYVQFLSIALASAAELETQMIICKSIKKFNKLSFDEVELQLKEIMKMLYVYINKLSD